MRKIYILKQEENAFNKIESVYEFTERVNDHVSNYYHPDNVISIDVISSNNRLHAIIKYYER